MAELVTVYLVALRVRALAYSYISEDHRTLENLCFLFYATCAPIFEVDSVPSQHIHIPKTVIKHEIR
jgi:hypothetical protein